MHEYFNYSLSLFSSAGYSRSQCFAVEQGFHDSLRVVAVDYPDPVSLGAHGRRAVQLQPDPARDIDEIVLLKNSQVVSRMPMLDKLAPRVPRGVGHQSRSTCIQRINAIYQTFSRPRPHLSLQKSYEQL